MTVDTEDRVPVPHYKARLWTALATLHDERTADPPSTVPGWDPTGRGARKRWLVAGLAASVIAAAVTVAMATARPDHAVVVDPSNQGHPVIPAPDPLVDTTGDLVQQLIDATGRASAEFIVHTVSRSTATGETNENWQDWTTHRYRGTVRDAHGVPIEEVGGALVDARDDDAPTDKDVLRIVNHCRHDFSDEAGSGMSGTPGWPFADHSGGDFQTPQNLHAVMAGTVTVDGEELARIKVVETGEILLVDPATSLAVRSTVGSGRADETVVTYDYLPRSSKNLASLTPPPVPDSYHELDMGSSEGTIDAPAWDPARPLPHPDCTDDQGL
jgi:hypothetical protein